MERYQLTLPLPTGGINLVDDSLIADNEAAEGTINISFKDGIPQTRKGYVKSSPFNFASDAKSLFMHRTAGAKTKLVASGGKIKKQAGASFTDITGAVSSDVVETQLYPCTVGAAHYPTLVLADGGAGSLAAGTYYYRIAAITANGQTDPCPEVGATVAASKAITLTWKKIQGATSYKIYGRTQNAELLMQTIASGDTLTWTDTGSVTPSGAMPPTNATASAFTDKLFILDGTTYQYYDAEGNALAAVKPRSPSSEEAETYGLNVLITTPDEVNKQKFILNDDERIWVSGYGKIVRISHLQQPDYFPSNQVWKLEEDCTGMGRFMGEVILFTDNTATLISGKTPNWELPEKYEYIKLPGGYGCSAHRSISVGNNAAYWANKSGVYRYRYLPSGYSIPECVSEFEASDGHKRTIKKWISEVTDWTKVYAVFLDQEYRLHLGGGKVAVFDTLGSTWALFEYDREFRCGLVDQNTLYYAGPYLWQMDYVNDPSLNTDGLSDDGVAITFKIKSKFFDFGKAANKKRFRKLYATLYTELTSYDIDLIMNLDNEYQTISNQITNMVARFGEMRFGERLNFSKTNLNYPVKINHRGKKYNLQYELVCDQLNMAFTLISLVLMLKVKELK